MTDIDGFSLHQPLQRLFVRDNSQAVDAAVKANLLTPKPTTFITPTTTTTATTKPNKNENEKENQENSSSNNAINYTNRKKYVGKGMMSVHYYTTTGENCTLDYFFVDYTNKPAIITKRTAKLQQQQQQQSTASNQSDIYPKAPFCYIYLHPGLGKRKMIQQLQPTITSNNNNDANLGPTPAKRSYIPATLADTAKKERYIDTLMFHALRQKDFSAPAGTYYDVVSITTETSARTIISHNFEGLSRIRIYNHYWDGRAVRFLPPRMFYMLQRRFLISYVPLTPTNFRPDLNRNSRTCSAAEATSIFVFPGPQQQQEYLQRNQQIEQQQQQQQRMQQQRMQQQQQQSQQQSTNQTSRIPPNTTNPGVHRYVNRSLHNLDAYRTPAQNVRLSALPNSIYRHVMNMKSVSVRCFDINTERECVIKSVNESADRIRQAYFKLQLDKEHSRSNYYGHTLIRAPFAILPCVMNTGEINHNRCFIVINPKPNNPEEIAMYTDNNRVCPAYEDLHSYMRRTRRLSEEEARGLFMQICETVRLCHRNGIILRDLKLKRFYFIDQER